MGLMAYLAWLNDRVSTKLRMALLLYNDLDIYRNLLKVANFLISFFL